MSLLILFGGGGSGGGAVTLTAVDGASNVLAEKRGGTVVTLTGTGFASSMTVDVLLAGSPVGSGYIFDPIFDVPSSTTAYVGLPAVDPGTYDLRVTVGVDTATLSNALTFVLFAEESKVHQARQSFASQWRLGPRILLNHTLELGNL